MARRAPPVRIGCSGWSIRSFHADLVPAEGSHLQRYAAALDAVEITSSFYRPHRRATYERWASAVPDGFRFAVKAPQAITHERRLHGCAATLDVFLEQIGGLGDRLGPILFQTRSDLPFDARRVERFLALLRRRHDGPVAWEPREAGWFSREASSLLRAHRVARVAADPPRHARGAEPGGWPGLRYWRWHGSPVIYRSAYTPARLRALASAMADGRSRGAERWAVFDNTVSGACITDALALTCQLRDA